MAIFNPTDPYIESTTVLSDLTRTVKLAIIKTSSDIECLCVYVLIRGCYVGEVMCTECISPFKLHKYFIKTLCGLAEGSGEGNASGVESCVAMH